MRWEMVTGTTRDYTVLVAVEEGNVLVRYFRASGKEMHWPSPPCAFHRTAQGINSKWRIKPQTPPSNSRVAPLQVSP
jgi:CRISPR/Cas system endoribonuclease Cas6 (RAMP superfamily)